MLPGGVLLLGIKFAFALVCFCCCPLPVPAAQPPGVNSLSFCFEPRRTGSSCVVFAIPPAGSVQGTREGGEEEERNLPNQPIMETEPNQPSPSPLPPPPPRDSDPICMVKTLPCLALPSSSSSLLLLFPPQPFLSGSCSGGCKPEHRAAPSPLLQTLGDSCPHSHLSGGASVLQRRSFCNPLLEEQLCRTSASPPCAPTKPLLFGCFPLPWFTSQGCSHGAHSTSWPPGLSFLLWVWLFLLTSSGAALLLLLLLLPGRSLVLNPQRLV